MTNFEYLKSLSLEEFGREVLKQVIKVHSDCFHSELDIFDIINDEEYAFENYLNAEHGKRSKLMFISKFAIKTTTVIVKPL